MAYILKQTPTQIHPNRAKYTHESMTHADSNRAKYLQNRPTPTQTVSKYYEIR